MITTIDQDHLGRLLLAVEADAHRRGWDGPPAIMVIYDATDQAAAAAYHQCLAQIGAPIRYRAYAARPMVPTDAVDGIASHALFRMAGNLGLCPDHPAVQLMIGWLRQPGFLGLAMSCESWSRVATPAECDALGPARFADLPGSMETRHVTSADITGQVRLVQRIRGQRPVLVARDCAWTGSIPESLRYATAAVAGQPLPGVPSAPSGWAP